MITKIDKDTFEIRTERVETVSLSQLEAEIEEINKYNQLIEDLRKQVKSIPEKLQQYVNIPLDRPIDKDKIDLIKTLKEING